MRFSIAAAQAAPKLYMIPAWRPLLLVRQDIRRTALSDILTQHPTLQFPPAHYSPTLHGMHFMLLTFAGESEKYFSFPYTLKFMSLIICIIQIFDVGSTGLRCLLTGLYTGHLLPDSNQFQTPSHLFVGIDQNIYMLPV